MSAAREQELIGRMELRSTAELQSFFASHGLGKAFDAPSTGWGRLYRISQALLEAERRDIKEEVLQDAWRRFGGSAPDGEPLLPVNRLATDLSALIEEANAWEGWLGVPVASSWIARLNRLLLQLRGHLPPDEVPDDFALEDWEVSGTGKTVTDPGLQRFQKFLALVRDLLPPNTTGIRPNSRMERLHDQIRSVSEQLFKDGHPAAAILEATKAVNNRVKRLSGLSLDGKGLMGRAFDEQTPVLRINAGETQSHKDEQEGFKFVFMGVMLGIRNPKAHDTHVPLDDDRAYEYLALASLLMRRLDDAESLQRE